MNVLQSVTWRGIWDLRPWRIGGIVILGVLAAEPALAHDEGGGGAGFLAGIFHPVLGFDHFLAMLSVGVISAQIGGRAIWYVPATFVLAMIFGGMLGMQEVNLLAVEAGIALSVLVLGVTLAGGKIMPSWIAIVSVTIFGIFHGHAHGTEMPLIANPWLYAAGFVLGTASIHLTGVLLGVVFRGRQVGHYVLRTTGVGIAGVGAYILINLWGVV